jgi:aspartyl-tRNA(Asn)/glutamyl-tRNA(Gln) amidotransferase subunit B
MAQYEAVIGLEVHVQLNTATKLFCSCRNHFGDPPNTNVCPVCLGLPGALPVVNHQAVAHAVRTGLLLNCTIAAFSKFDRKHYFYPDLPKAYQISQYDLPICRAGWLEIRSGEQPLRIGITRVHMEEDAGKLIHDECAGGSLVDLNRTGTPLLEIVSEPELHTPDAAYAYLATLKQLISYLGVSDCNMEEGSLRCDANVSVRPAGVTTLGTKVEIKNLNSFKGVHKALSYEIERQTKAVTAGQIIVQETRLFDAAQEKTFSMRSKEAAHDYRYFPDPDLTPMTFSPAQIEAARATLPELPRARKARFVTQFALSEYDAALLTSERAMAEYFEATVQAGASGKAAANWIGNNLLTALNAAHLALDQCRITPAQLAEMIGLVETNAISSTNAKNDVFPTMFATGADPQAIMDTKGLRQVSDSTQIDAWVRAALEQNPVVIAALKTGKAKAAGTLVGAVMRLSQGKANPALVNERIAALTRAYLPPSPQGI